MRTLAITAMVALVALAGCLSGEEADKKDEVPVVESNNLLSALAKAGAKPGFMPITLNESIVTSVVTPFDAYEPTMDVCDDGSIYITGHTFLVDTTGAPVFGSHDDGATWDQLPWFQEETMPMDTAGSTPPPSDEIFLVCGDDGWLYGADITLATFPVNGWSNYGTTHAYHNPNAYDEYQVAAQANECAAAPIKDRPWIAYGAGKMLLVNNDGAGPAQIGVLDAPPLGPAGVGATAGLGRWNMCAGPNYAPAMNSIEGIPDMRPDGFFAVPQLANGYLTVTTGNAANIFNLDTVSVFPHSTGGEITSVYGQAVFDADGIMYVGVSQNSAPDADDNNNRTGGMRLAVSKDNGNTFEWTHFEGEAGLPLRHFYMDGNKAGQGSLVVWANDGNTTALNEDGEEVVAAWDWYMGHLFIGKDGKPDLRNVALVIDEGLMPSAHVTGAAVGPDGRAYTAMYDPNRAEPLSVFIQRGGPQLPVPKEEVPAMEA